MHAVIFKDPAKYEGKTVIVVGERITHPQIASTLSEVTGKTVKCASLTQIGTDCVDTVTYLSLCQISG